MISVIYMICIQYDLCDRYSLYTYHRLDLCDKGLYTRDTQGVYDLYDLYYVQYDLIVFIHTISEIKVCPCT